MTSAKRDPAAGHAAYASTCAACHGADGALLLLEDGAFTLGSFARREAYEGWLKVLVGHPGRVMGPRVPAGPSRAEQATWILDVFAALCDRGAWGFAQNRLRHRRCGCECEAKEDDRGDSWLSRGRRPQESCRRRA